MSATMLLPGIGSIILEELTPPCDGNDCEHPANWIGIKLCCDMIYLWCQQHHDVLVVALANHTGYECFKCHAIDPPVRWERLRWE